MPRPLSLAAFAPQAVREQLPRSVRAPPHITRTGWCAAPVPEGRSRSLGSPGARPPCRADRREAAVNYPLLNVFFTTMWVFLWILWFFLLFRVFGDLFRDQ